MTRVWHTIGDFLLDVWGGGTAVALTHKPTGLSVHWQGDEATDILHDVEHLGYEPSTFEALWAAYSGVAQ
jgi:hypothetical protein